MICIGTHIMGEIVLDKAPVRPFSDKNYLYFQSYGDADTSVSLIAPSSFNVSFEISTDGTTWCNWGYDTVNSQKVFSRVTLPLFGDYVFIRASSVNTWNALPSRHLQFVFGDGLIKSGGSVMSLIKSDASLVSFEYPSTCFYNLFQDCKTLTTAPELPATSLIGNCYDSMFQGCTSLTQAPALPSTTLVYSCYYGMFRGCVCLTTAPALPAETLADNCYQEMFYGCISLTQAPALPATTLASNCYSSMFSSCSALNYVRVEATAWNTSYANNWLYSVASVGTFTKPTGTTIASGASGIPNGWTVVNY